MQNIVPTGSNNPNNHTRREILDALVGATGTRKLTFNYQLLDRNNTYLRMLPEVLQCTVTQDWLADIKRTAQFTIEDAGGIDYLSNRIQPWIRLHLPPYGTGDWVQWPQGVFLLSTPTRSSDDAGVVTRQVDAYDPLQVFADDLTTSRYSVAAGAKYTDAVVALLGSTAQSVVPASATLPTAKDWDYGTSKLSIINELLAAVNYNSLAFDEYGRALVRPYMTPGDRAEEYQYADDATSVITPQVSQTLDLFGVPNKWTLLVSDPDRPALVSSYTNTSPGSPTSTVRRGRTITDFRQEQDAADQATLDAKVAKLAFEASQVYEAIEFHTAIMPIHSGNDVYRLTYGPLAIAAKYSEQSWSISFEAGQMMQHKARRVVTV